jgi:sterol desaturase/sphingolipid hydroxylase (fatty acid hydroxylase superfamily)
MASHRKASQELQGNILDATTTGAVLGLLYYNPDFFNPWHLKIWEWFLGAMLIRAAILFYDHLVVFMVDTIFKNNLLPTRTTGKPVRYVELDTKSLVYLSINSLHEWVFVQRLCHFLWYSPDVPLVSSEISLLNTFGALSVMFIVLDTLYAPCHHILHMPRLYPLIHKHHHRQHFPTRGYLDAGNEHPLEHVVGVMSIWGAVLAAVYGPTGAHACTLFVFFNIHAALAMLNHSPYNVEFSLVPGLVKYSVGNHEMHHRKFTVNYAQYCMWYDHAVQSFAPYEGPKKLT